MKKDIKFPQIENVYVTVVEDREENIWKVYPLNRNEKRLETVMITSRDMEKNMGKAKRHQPFVI